MNSHQAEGLTLEKGSYLQVIRHALCGLLVAAVLLIGTPSVSAMDPIAQDARPVSTLDVQDVVRIQLEALRRNDAQDRGIAIAFRFASPSNQRNTGPLERFAGMLKDGPYALMLRFTHASYEAPQIIGRQAAQRVTVFAPGADAVTFVFYLSRQITQGPLQDCWMTDAVQILRTQGTPA